MPSNPRVRDAIDRLVDSMKSIHDDSLDLLTQTARDTVAGAEFASITVVHADGVVETLAPTDPLIVTVDQLQGELGEGPCFDAAVEEETYVAEDLRDDERWPVCGPKAAALGIVAQMGVDLHHPGDARAALNFYATEPAQFRRAIDTAELFASHASIVLGYVVATDHFQSALKSRKTIGQAIGIVMERYTIDEERAFRFLARVSQTSQVKLREVAADIVAEANTANRP